MPFIKTILIAVITGVSGFVQYTFPERCSITNAIQQEVTNFVDGWVLLLLLVAPSLISFAFELLERSNAKKHHPEAPGIFLATINEAVGMKKERFMNHTVEDGSDTFLEITKPEDQIHELIQQLFRATSSTLGPVVDSVVLAKFCESEILKLYHAPRAKPPRLTDEDLMSGKTFFHKVQKTGEDQTIPSLKKLYLEQSKMSKRQLKEKQKFIFSKTDQSSDGSIIGYPIKLKNGKTEAVLTLYSRQTKIKNMVKPIEEFIKMYSDRIALELCLNVLKTEHAEKRGM